MNIHTARHLTAAAVQFGLRSVRHSSSQPKVALLGASGGIGQPLGLLLKQDALVKHLALYDLVGTPGVQLIFLILILLQKLLPILAPTNSQLQFPMLMLL
ncbi:malate DEHYDROGENASE, NAD-dependent [Parelaphostrongylus tenuis]|uniref:Malate dehydrogenase, mitochondrial n=1 Tax=Parelaphostrongylus tenuis TaxID=148309 RepID=A0AAD5QCT9_PARTN|nr:malate DEHYDROGENASE, NAD-dependent [Parelaphostrongylus tenuis]